MGRGEVTGSGLYLLLFSMIDRLTEIETRLLDIESRNSRVETDKAWEGSLCRVGSIAVMTYVIAVIVMMTISAGNPFLGACVPVVGFVLSTQTLPFLKKWWIVKRESKR